jgi:hypothetical protein
VNLGYLLLLAVVSLELSGVLMSFVRRACRALIRHFLKDTE